MKKNGKNNEVEKKGEERKSGRKSELKRCAQLGKYEEPMLVREEKIERAKKMP